MEASGKMVKQWMNPYSNTSLCFVVAAFNLTLVPGIPTDALAGIQF